MNTEDPGILQVLDKNLKKEEDILHYPSSIINITNKSISKLVLIISLAPPVVLALFTHLSKLKNTYLFIFLVIYFSSLFWLLEANFDAFLNYIVKFKNYIKSYV